MGKYEKAEKGKTYDFSSVDFYIRILNDPTLNIPDKDFVKIESTELGDGKAHSRVFSNPRTTRFEGTSTGNSYWKWLSIVFGAAFWMTCGACCVACCWINW